MQTKMEVQGHTVHLENLFVQLFMEGILRQLIPWKDARGHEYPKCTDGEPDGFSRGWTPMTLTVAISFFALQRVESHEAERKCQVLMKVPHRKGRKFRSFQTRWCSTRAPCAKKMRKCIIEVCIKYVYPGTHESIAGTGSVQIKLNETNIWRWLLVAISTELVPL